MSDLELPTAIRYVQALGPTVAAFVAAVIASIIQYRMWKISNDKIRLDLFDRRVRIYNAIYSDLVDQSGNIDQLVEKIKGIIQGMDGYQFLFDQKAVGIISNIEIRLMVISSKIKSYPDGFDIHRFVINEANAIWNLKQILSPLIIDQLSFVN